MSSKAKEYPAIDIMKIIMAILIFLAHFMSEDILLKIKSSSFLGVTSCFFGVVLFSATILHLSKKYKVFRMLW